MDDGWCLVAVRGAVLQTKGQRSRAKTNGNIVEFQPRDAEHNRVVAELCDEHRQGLLVLKYCKAGVGNMGNVTRRYWAAVDDLEASGILKGCKRELVMACEVFVYKSDSSGSAVDEGMGGNGPVIKGDFA